MYHMLCVHYNLIFSVHNRTQTGKGSPALISVGFILLK